MDTERERLEDLEKCLKNLVESYFRWKINELDRSHERIADYESVEQFAAKIDYSPKTVRRWCQAGKIKGAKRLNRKWIIPADEAKRMAARLAEQGKL